MNWAREVYSGWGRTRQAAMLACAPRDAVQSAAALRAVGAEGLIGRGAGRSYGDAALNSGGRALLTRRLNRILAFEPQSGEIVCEAGVSFADLLHRLLPQGFLAPVTPGTGFATIGGAVAHDVHGKNHEHAGAFGKHVRWLDLLLPDGETVRVGPDIRPELFRATVGGLGLTGIVLRVAFRMLPVASNAVRVHERRIGDLDAFLDALAGARATFSVGWLDALAGGRHLGRGILETAELSERGLPAAPMRRLRMPVDLPGWVLNPLSVGAFNAAYLRRVPPQGRERLQRLDRFLYPLDAVLDWNRMYGRRGFYQFQCVLPEAQSARGLVRLLETVSRARGGSFLAVLKRLGGEGPGFLSFPMRGYTLALDFPRRRGTEALLRRLEAITLEHGGRVYLAKDACLSPEAFAAMYPGLPAFRAVLSRIDPWTRMRSDLARRLRIHDPATPASQQRRQPIRSSSP